MYLDKNKILNLAMTGANLGPPSEMKFSEKSQMRSKRVKQNRIVLDKFDDETKLREQSEDEQSMSAKSDRRMF